MTSTETGAEQRTANQLDPAEENAIEKKKLPLIIKVYGFLCMAAGIVTLSAIAFIFGIIIWALINDPDQVTIGTDPTLTIIVTGFDVVLAVGSAVALIIFGAALLRNRRRNAARWAYILIPITVLQMLCDVMLSGISMQLIRPAVQLAILILLSVTVDPALRQERELQRRLRDMLDREAARVGLLGRDETGEGYIKLNFFNLFWVFTVCSVIGLILEIIWHMVVVDPGVYQDRAGLLFGPFSPIYGVGAVLMTAALNRFYDRHFIIIFLVSAVIGGAFEFAVSWFMQTAFGAIAWDYSHATLFGLMPDPVAVLCQGRTSTMFAGIWGLLGLAWIKLLLPRLLGVINLIPWKLRYSLTTVCAALMLVNAVMTLHALDCWFERVSGIQPTSPVEEFYADHFDNAYMEHRFQSMTINPKDSSRVEHAPQA